MKPPITGAQLRAARAMLNWSVRNLSTRCGVSQSAIARAEKVDGTLSMQSRNIDAITSTLEQCGIVFLEGNGLRLS